MKAILQRVRAHPLAGWLVPMGVTVAMLAAVASYGRSPEVQAAPGSPYYGKAVQEAMRGLVQLGAGTQPGADPAGRPPLPVGLSPAEHYWCEQCKAWHKRNSNAGSAAATPSAPTPAAAGAGIPPLPPGLSPADYDWCANCKAWHPKEPAKPAQPAAQPAAQPPAPSGP